MRANWLAVSDEIQLDKQKMEIFNILADFWGHDEGLEDSTQLNISKVKKWSQGKPQIQGLCIKHDHRIILKSSV